MSTAVDQPAPYDGWASLSTAVAFGAALAAQEVWNGARTASGLGPAPVDSDMQTLGVALSWGQGFVSRAVAHELVAAALLSWPTATLVGCACGSFAATLTRTAGAAAVRLLAAGRLAVPVILPIVPVHPEEPEVTASSQGTQSEEGAKSAASAASAPVSSGKDEHAEGEDGEAGVQPPSSSVDVGKPKDAAEPKASEESASSGTRRNRKLDFGPAAFGLAPPSERGLDVDVASNVNFASATEGGMTTGVSDAAKGDETLKGRRPHVSDAANGDETLKGRRPHVSDAAKDYKMSDWAGWTPVIGARPIRAYGTSRPDPTAPFTTICNVAYDADAIAIPRR